METSQEDRERLRIKVNSLSRYEIKLVETKRGQIDRTQPFEYYFWVGEIKNGFAEARTYYDKNIFSPFIKDKVSKKFLDSLGCSQNDFITARKETGAETIFSKSELPPEQVNELEKRIAELDNDFEIYYEIRNSNCPSRNPRYDSVELRVSLSKNGCCRDTELGGGYLPSESNASGENEYKSLFEDLGIKERDPIRIKISNETIIGISSPLDETVVKEYLLYCNENDEGNARFSVFRERTSETELGEINLWDSALNVLKCEANDHFLLQLKEKNNNKWLEISRFDYTEKEKEEIVKELNTLVIEFKRFKSQLTE